MNKMQEEYRQLDDRFTRLSKEHNEQQVVVQTDLYILRKFSNFFVQ